MTTPPLATILITTKNRKDDLAAALESCFAQTVPGGEIEVFVIDDGSTDGTGELIRSRFPRTRYERSEQSRGCVVQRSRGVKTAAAPIVFSIDDDAIFTTPHIVAQTLRDFDHPRVGAVAIPYREVKYDPHAVWNKAPGPQGVHVINEYRGCAHALRRELFERLGGYREALFFAGEEGDYCLRMLATGHVVRLGNSDHIDHLESPNRDRSRYTSFSARNGLLLAWANAPLAKLPWAIAGSSIGMLRWAAKRGYTRACLRGIWQGLSGIARGVVVRAPVPARVYDAFQWLKARRQASLEELDHRLA